MKAKELIKILEKYSDEVEVMYWDAEEDKHYIPVIRPAFKNRNRNETVIIEFDRYC